MKKILLFTIVAISTQVQAQKKTTYFPNGNKSFEGEYRLGYAPADTRDLYNFDTAADKRKAGMVGMATRAMEREAPVLKIYNGPCVFYYDNGKVSYSGTFNNGIKNGLFTYSYFGGAKEAEYNYVNGMADGKWKGWHQNGKLRLEQSYSAFTEGELDTLYDKKISGANPFAGNPMTMERRGFRNFANDSLRKLPGNTFTKFTELENSFYKNAHWNGDFVTYYENGAKCTEMHYKKNVRVGKWYYWSDSGKVYVELTFTDGKIMDAVSNAPKEQPHVAGAMDRPTPPGMGGQPNQERMMAMRKTQDSMRTAMMAGRPGQGDPMAMRKTQDSMRTAMLAQREQQMAGRPGQGDPMAMRKMQDSMRTAMMAQRQQQPDQQPVASVDVNSYVKEHLVYPETAKKNKLEGMVLVKFMVNEDGTTGEYGIMKGLGSGCDEEAIRIVKSMPAWKPAKKAGQPMKASYMLPVQFKLAAAKK